MNKTRQLCAAILIAGMIPTPFATGQTHGSRAVGAVFTASNAVSGNEVLIFERLANGGLRAVGSVETGGLGTGAGLENQGGLVLSGDQRFLLTVNAGSDTISAFKVKKHGLHLLGSIGSGGGPPVSITEDRGLVYVLNAGGSSIPGNISGFRMEGLFVGIEARVDKTGQAAEGLIFAQYIVVQRIGTALDDLGTGGAVDMDYRWDPLSVGGLHIGRYGHEAARLPVAPVDLEDPVRVFILSHRARVVKALVEDKFVPSVKADELSAIKTVGSMATPSPPASTATYKASASQVVCRKAPSTWA